MNGIEIYCLKCAGRPTAESRWMCSKKVGGCGTVWNTFATRGVCPGCAWHWNITRCLQCRQWSEHHRWYHELPPHRRKKRQREQALTDA